MIYWDSSALIKKYLREEGSDVVHRRLKADSVVITSQIAYAEVHATFARKLREKAFSTRIHQKICRLFDADWKAMIIVRMDDVLLPVIRDLLVRHPLRSADSIHLASAVHVSERARHSSLSFACADEKLLEAAIKEGLAGWNPLVDS